MPSRRNIFQTIWPDETTFQTLRETWLTDATIELLRSTWSGLDSLQAGLLDQIGGVHRVDRQKERSITQLLVLEIRKALSPASPFGVEHEWFEQETLHSDQAQPPQYDICFVHKQNRRILWPIEAKVLPTDAQVSNYVHEITGNFLTCRYAPLSYEGGMLGYLMKGSPVRAFENIAGAVPCKLLVHQEFKNRDHRVSHHSRKVPEGKRYPDVFTCHHLIFRFRRDECYDLLSFPG